LESEWVKGRWYVYLLRCCDASLYCGISNDLLARVDKHNSGLGAKYTRSRRPVCIVYAKRLRNHGSALKHEYRIKQLSKAEKEKLCLSLALPRKRRARAVKKVRKS
jgi:putative endonuclease